MVNFARRNLIEELNQIGSIRDNRHSAKKNLNAAYVRILIEVVNLLGIEGRGAADNAVQLFEQYLRR